MKKLILFLIPVAVGASLLISCNGQKPQEAEEQTEAPVSQASDVLSAPDGSIVYVNLDSLTQNYLMTKDLTAELEEKMKKLDAELTNKQKTFQSNVTDFQNKAQKGLETRAKLAEMEQQLGADQQALVQLSESYRMQMAEEQAVMQRKIIQAIMDYLKIYNKDKRYKYILGDTFDAKILYADPSLDITASVLEGINAAYKAEHPAPAKK
jgi:outer membrane protein